MANLEQNNQQTALKISELEGRQQKLQIEIGLRLEDLKQQRQRQTELQLTEKAMNQDLSALADHLNEQNHESNFLLRRNS